MTVALPADIDQPLSSVEEARVATYLNANGYALTKPKPSDPRSSVFAASVGEAIERAMHETRDALSTEDTASAVRHIETASALVYGHPELPHSAFLCSEVERLAARVLRARSDAEGEVRALRQARALDGGRVSALGELTGEGEPQRVVASFVLPRSGSPKLWLDGRPVETSSVELEPSRHHLRITGPRGTVRSQWLEIRSAGTIDLTGFVLPHPTPCTLEDLEASGETQCRAWVRIRHEGLRLGVSLCREQLCASPTWLSTAPPAKRLPTWLPWAIAGAVGLTALSITAIQLGTQEQPKQAPFFSSGGLTLSFR